MQSFITGQFLINLDLYPEKPVRLVGIEKRYPEIPTVSSTLPNLAKTLQELPKFVPLAEMQRLFAVAREPKRLWVIKASDHRFSDNLTEFDQRLLEAMAWVTQHAVRRGVVP